MPIEDAVDQIDLSEILQVTSPEMRAGLQPRELPKGLALLLVHSHPEIAVAFVGLIMGHMILKNLQEEDLAVFSTVSFRNSALKKQVSSTLNIFAIFILLEERPV